MNRPRGGVDWIIGASGGSCERDTQPTDSIKGGEFLDQMSDYQHLRKNSSHRGVIN